MWKLKPWCQGCGQPTPLHELHWHHFSDSPTGGAWGGADYVASIALCLNCRPFWRRRKQRVIAAFRRDTLAFNERRRAEQRAEWARRRAEEGR